MRKGGFMAVDSQKIKFTTMVTIFYNQFPTHKLGMWLRFRASIESMFSSEDAHDVLLIGNYRLGKFIDWDAILVVGKEVILFEFKPINCSQVIITNRQWVDDNGQVIPSGKKKETPFLQLRYKRNILRNTIFEHGVDYIKTVVLFPDDFELLDYSRKPDLSTRPWFQISSMSRIPELIERNLDAPSDNDEDTLSEMKDYFLLNSPQYLLRSDKDANCFDINSRGFIDFSRTDTSASCEIKNQIPIDSNSSDWFLSFL